MNKNNKNLIKKLKNKRKKKFNNNSSKQKNLLKNKIKIPMRFKFINKKILILNPKLKSLKKMQNCGKLIIMIFKMSF